MPLLHSFIKYFREIKLYCAVTPHINVNTNNNEEEGNLIPLYIKLL